MAFLAAVLGLQAVEIPYHQLTPEKALETYCDWIVSQLPKYNEPPRSGTSRSKNGKQNEGWRDVRVAVGHRVGGAMSSV